MSSLPLASVTTPSFPAALQLQLAHAERLARVVRVLREQDAPDESALLWLTGRAEEIEAFVDDVMQDWLAGRLDSAPASASIAWYVASLHVAMEPWYGRWFAPSCCGPAETAEVTKMDAAPGSRVRVKRMRTPGASRETSRSSRLLSRTWTCPTPSVSESLPRSSSPGRD